MKGKISNQNLITNVDDFEVIQRTTLQKFQKQKINHYETRKLHSTRSCYKSKTNA